MNAVLVLLVAVNPVAVAAVLGGRVDRRVVVAGLAATGLATVALAAGSDALLDLLSVTAPTFQVAAGAVLLAVALRWLAFGPRLLPAEEGLLKGDGRRDASLWSDLAVPVLVPVLVTPQVVMASVAEGADEGVVTVLAGAALALTLAGVATMLYRGRPGIWSAAVRLGSLLTAAVASGMIADGIRSV